MVLSLVAFVTLLPNSLGAADWPAYRGNSARTATTSEKLTYPLKEVWKYVPKRKPLPAWPDKFMAEVAGCDFDYAPQVVIVGEAMYFGSTSDNTLWALDAATGKTKWGFTMGAPVRFAPAIWEGKAYVVSDDGYAYCLDAASGKLIWKFYGGLYDSRFIANQRMASRWLIRSGVVADDGMVNFAVGMWASEGVYAYALDAKTGKQLWVNDTSLKYRNGPHNGQNFAGNKPQGYALAAKNQLVFHNGQAGCYIYDRRTGVETGHIDTRSEIRRGGRGDASVQVIREDGTIETGHGVKTQATIQQNWAVAGDTVIMCGKNRIMARRGSPADNRVVWEHTITGTIMGLAVANGMLVVSTTDGVIHCFKSGKGGNALAVGPGTKKWAKPAPGPAADVLAKCKAHGISKGYALVLGETDAKLAEALAANTDLQVICVLGDKDKVASERIRLRDTTDIYGLEVTVDHLADTKKLPYPQYFANVIVVNGKAAGFPAGEIRRVQRPCGGIVIAGGKVDVRGKLPGAFDWDSKVTCDQRVKWPLEMLWFGEPGPMNTRGKGSGPPIPVNGIALYVSKGIVAVDAYNGTVLWRWKHPEGTNRGHVNVDARYLYTSLTLKTDRRRKSTPLTLDVKTGKRVKGVTAPATLGRYKGARRSHEDVVRYLGTRIHPLTGGLVSKGFGKSHGCVGAQLSAAMDFFRSGSFSNYDFEDDSGVRNLAGLRPACHPSKTGELGLLLVADGQGANAVGVPNKEDYGSGCDCRFSFLGALAMAPVKKQRNEDWATFSDPKPELTAGPVRHVNMNFGAPGDRRHTDKKLWLSAPRPVGRWLGIHLPYLVEFYDGTQGDLRKGQHDYYGGSRSYRRNADRLAIGGTDQPWVYASGYRGLKSLALGLDYYQWDKQYVVLPCATAPKIDGKLTDACWDAAGEVFLVHTEARNRPVYMHQMPNPGESAWMRHDKDNLYVAYRQNVRKALKNIKPPSHYVKKCKIAHFDLLLKGSGGKVVHLGVSPSGATYDALIATTGAGRRMKTSEPDVSWKGDWQSAVSVKDRAFIIEVAVPWKTLAALGINRNELQASVHRRVNVKYLKQPNVRSMKNVHLSTRSAAPRPYSVWLHFADLENTAPGKRVFDVKLQGKVVLKDFDIVAAAGAGNKAVVKEFKGIMALNEIKLELVSRAKDMKGIAAPIISGMQVLAEQPGPVPKPVLGIMTNDKENGGFKLFSDLEKMTAKQRMGTRGWLPQDEEALQKSRARRGLPPLKKPRKKK
jgi:outer membrane protein assembly factor BamB